jgi:hypothetical protein
LGGLISKVHDRDNNDHEGSRSRIYALIIGSYREPPATAAAPGNPACAGFGPSRIGKNWRLQEFRRGNSFRNTALGQPGFGEFDRNPQVDLRHDLVQLGVAGRLAKVAGYGLQPQHCGVIERAGQQAEF